MADWKLCGRNWSVFRYSPIMPEQTEDKQHSRSPADISDSDVQHFIKFVAWFIGYLVSLYLLHGFLGAEDDRIIK
jgi:hypothetical protein